MSGAGSGLDQTGHLVMGSGARSDHFVASFVCLLFHNCVSLTQRLTFVGFKKCGPGEWKNFALTVPVRLVVIFSTTFVLTKAN